MTDSRAAPAFPGPHWKPWRGPFQRWPNLSDFLLASTSFALTLLLWADAAGHGLQIQTFPDIAVFLCAFIGNYVLLWRRTHPLQVHAVVLAASLLALASGVADGIFALTFSLYSVGRYTADNRASLLAMLVALAYIVGDLFVLGAPNMESVFAASLVVLLWYIGRRFRFRGEYLRLLEERAEHLDRARHIDAERAVAEERTRIARELHDVVAHQVSLMTVQAGAAHTVARSDPQAAAEAMSAVEKAGRQALTEMRHLLSVLRPDNPVDVLGPQPGIADLPRLVREVNDAGPNVMLSIDPGTGDLPARVDLAVYRIVQEALTNVLKHAGNGVNVDVRVELADGHVEVQVKDDGERMKDEPGTGHGIAGMRERAQILGGTLLAGPHPDQGFEVLARIPAGARAA